MRMRRIGVALAMFLAACLGDSTSAPPTPRLTTLTVAAAAASIVAGTTTTVTASGRDQQGQPIATGPVTWTSSNSAVATVDGAGTVTGVAAGATTLIATASGITASTSLTVSPPAPRLTILTVTAAAASIVAGTTTTVTASGRDQQGQPIATGPVTWTSSNPAVATVDGTGTVTGVVSGAVTVTATASGITASTALTVTPAPALSRLTVTLSTAAARSGERVTVTVTGFDQFNGSFPTPTVTLSSSVPIVATVQPDGTLLPALVGTTVIRANVGAIAASANLTVSAGPAAKLRLWRPASRVFNAWRFGVQPQIAVTDLAGNFVTTDPERLVRLSAPDGVLGTATASTTAGMATFTNAGVLAATGASTVLTFTATGFAPVEQTVTVELFSFLGGVRLVGVDIRPGRYRSLNPQASSCYWARLRNTTGSDDIIANSIGSGPRLLEVLSTDVAVATTSQCAAYTEIVGPATASPTATFYDGMYLVGVDIAPGTWRGDAQSTSCYWARLRNINGTDAIIANYYGSTPAIMTVLATDVAVEVSRCGVWTRVP